MSSMVGKGFVVLDMEEQSKETKFSQKFDAFYFGKHRPFLFLCGQPFLTLGPDWPFYLGMITFMMVIGGMCCYYVLGRQETTFLQYLVCLSTFFQWFIYSYTSFRNPENQQLPISNYCPTCRVSKQQDREHCEDCDICIDGYDHHCPWTGKCIGQQNIIPFYLFLVSTIAFFVICLLSVLSVSVIDAGNRRK